MTSNESKAKAELIWSKLYSIKNQNLTKDEQISMIEKVVIDIAQEQRLLGRNQILNHLQDVVTGLRS